MKHGTLHHRKTRRLMRRLGKRGYAVLGIIEALVHFTMAHAPTGNLSACSAEDVACWIDWEGEPTDLIEALVDAGFLDRPKCCANHVLAMHDWHLHAQRSVVGRLQRARQSGGANDRFDTCCEVAALGLPLLNGKRALARGSSGGSVNKGAARVPVSNRPKPPRQADTAATKAPARPRALTADNCLHAQFATMLDLYAPLDAQGTFGLDVQAKRDRSDLRHNIVPWFRVLDPSHQEDAMALAEEARKLGNVPVALFRYLCKKQGMPIPKRSNERPSTVAGTALSRFAPQSEVCH